MRLAFRTRATALELDLLRTRTILVGVPDRPDGMVDLLIDGHLMQHAATIGGDVVRVDPGTDIPRGSADPLVPCGSPDCPQGTRTSRSGCRTTNAPRSLPCVPTKLPDNLHPDASTHQIIGERFTRLAFSGHGPFGR